MAASRSEESIIKMSLTNSNGISITTWNFIAIIEPIAITSTTNILSGANRISG
jgi:hypothetical protein